MPWISPPTCPPIGPTSAATCELPTALPLAPSQANLLLSDNVEGRALGLDGFNNGTSMTNERCILFCMDRGYSMAGTEYGAECCKMTFAP